MEMWTSNKTEIMLNNAVQTAFTLITNLQVGIIISTYHIFQKMLTSHVIILHYRYIVESSFYSY